MSLIDLGRSGLWVLMGGGFLMEGALATEAVLGSVAMVVRGG